MAKFRLYRHFNHNGRLLYVGISMSIATRLLAHQTNAEWFDNVTCITIETYPSKEDALIAERNAIIKEKPAFNISGQLNNGTAGTGTKKSEHAVLITVTELAKRLNISRRCAYHWLSNDKLPIKPIEGMKPPKWRVADVDAFCKGR